MSIDYDKTEKEIIMKKLCKDKVSLQTSSESNKKILDSLYRMNMTAVNRSYRQVVSGGTLGKVKVLLKRLMRRLTFWYVEPCMMQQTEYNTANNEFSSEVNGEINRLNETNRNLKETIEKMSKDLSDMKNRLESMESNIICVKEVEKNEIKISFSQSGEDNIIRYILNILGRNISEMTYLDLGANHAVHLSNTYGFYSEGARGVLLEANPELAKELSIHRPEDVVINKCLSEKSGEETDFYILNGDGLSSPNLNAVMGFIKENPTLKIEKTVSVGTITIKEITDRYFADKAPDLMNVDIEGMELEILKATDFEKFRPLIIICEMIEYKNGLTVGEKNQEIIDFMKSVGYTEFAFTGINSIFTDDKATGGKEK